MNYTKEEFTKELESLETLNKLKRLTPYGSARLDLARNVKNLILYEPIESNPIKEDRISHLIGIYGSLILANVFENRIVSAIMIILSIILTVFYARSIINKNK